MGCFRLWTWSLEGNPFGSLYLHAPDSGNSNYQNELTKVQMYITLRLIVKKATWQTAQLTYTIRNIFKPPSQERNPYPPDL
jgi:hypothetical protein